MKTVRRCGICLLVWLALGKILVSSAAAQGPRGLGVEFGVFGGVFLPDKHHEFYDPMTQHQTLSEVTPDFGLHLGFFPVSFLGLEAEGSAALSETNDGGSASLYSARGALVLQLPFRIAPFVLAGVGTTWLRSEQTE